MYSRYPYFSFIELPKSIQAGAATTSWLAGGSFTWAACAVKPISHVPWGESVCWKKKKGFEKKDSKGPWRPNLNLESQPFFLDSNLNPESNSQKYSESRIPTFKFESQLDVAFYMARDHPNIKGHQSFTLRLTCSHWAVPSILDSYIIGTQVQLIWNLNPESLPVWNLNLESLVRFGAWIPNPWPPSSRALFEQLHV